LPKTGVLRMDELKKQLKEIIVNDLKLPDVKPEDINDTDALFGDGLGLDSLDAVELVVLIQKTFGVQIEDMEEGRKAFSSIQALAEFIIDRKGC
jgi:acyl carrier protein